MENREKAIWLIKNYKSYSLEWYLSDLVRLNAIYQTQFSKFIKKSIEAERDRIKTETDEKLLIMKKVYLRVYGTEYDSDFKNSRSDTIRKSLDISSLWTKEFAEIKEVRKNI